MNRKLLLSTFATALGGLLFGYETAIINGALPFLTDYFEFSDFSKGFAVSAALFGSIAGAFTIGRPSDRFGRVVMLKVMALLFIISSFGTGFAWNISTLVIFRFIGGIAVGGCSVLSPLYIAEISPAKYRGRLGITFQLAIVTGILLAFFVDYLLLNTGPNNWRFMLVSMALPSLIFFILLQTVSRSPRWLVKEGREQEARDVLTTLDRDANVDEMVEEISRTLRDHSEVKLSYVIKHGYLNLIILGVLIGMFNQFTGINIVMYYATDIFRSAGFSTHSAIGQTVAIGFINLIFTLVAMYLIDKVGRKKLLLTGTLGMSVFLGLFSYAFMNGVFPDWSLLLFLLGFTAFFSSSQGAVVWVLLAEMFPNDIRAFGTSIGSFSLWFFNGVTTLLYPIVVGMFQPGMGTGYVFMFYAIMTFFSFFVFKKYLYEMKGKTLESLSDKTH